MENAETVVVGDKIHRPLFDETLTEEDLRVARVELNETPEQREVALRVVKQMLNEQTEFMSRTDDVFLLRFLRCKKFDCERTFKTIRDHYKFKQANPKVFPAPSGIEHALRANIYNFLPHRDHKGRAIYVVKPSRWNLKEVSYNDFVAAGNLVAEYVLDNAVTQINGFIGIWDYNGFSMQHLFNICSPKRVILLTTLMQDRFPARFKVAYCVNCHPLTTTAFNLLGPLLKEKFRNRVKILGSDINEMHKYLDPAILPPEYNGTMTIPETQQVTQGLLDKEGYFNYNSKFGYNKF
ncbi:hypothetical protein JTE90_027002 [Oedothorax gibbosus]|uniref:CRAL-TRIO domain-containing protein n=1 Tax=Oedothorax gibbosus TaxID=931172 RepID=A0AAV6VBL4_9ARAC|nr:hypothetical protein JTE90_027002 [Oedothorax gibbosus]